MKNPFNRAKMAASGSARHQLSKIGKFKNNISVLKSLPFSEKDYIIHMESQFALNMTWENQGVYNPETFDLNPTWQLDHIVPIDWFYYESVNDLGFKMCWSLDNIRPLVSKQNISEGNRKKLVTLYVKYLLEIENIHNKYGVKL